MSSALGWIAGLVDRLRRSLSAFRVKAAIAWKTVASRTTPILVQRGGDVVIVVKGTAAGRRPRAQGGAARSPARRKTRRPPRPAAGW